ncbi:MAG: ABC transporter permease [Bacteroidetes bacterium]|nr:ABC transporter permease [Bacteroidota bacterium]
MSNPAKILTLVISTEIQKLRNTVALWLTLLYPIGSVFLASLFLYAGRENVKPEMVNFINNFNSMLAFFLPFFAVLMVSFLCQVEQRNSMPKHLFALPVPRWALYFGKLAASFLLMGVAWLLLILLVYLSLFILGSFSPRLKLSSSFDHTYLILLLIKTFLSAAALIVIQYLLSLRLRSVVAPIAIGTSLIILPIAILFVLGITGLISNPKMLEWLLRYDPYSYPFAFVFKISQGGEVKSDLFSWALTYWLIVAAVLSVLGYYEWRIRNIK